MSASRCPVCGGTLASWVIRPVLACHHCGWGLAANMAQASRWAWGLAAVAEVLLLAGLWWWTGSTGRALDVYLAVSCGVGFVVWQVVYRSLLRLRPFKPPPRTQG